MMKIQGFILYKIYYSYGVVYLGRTKQPLQNRIRGHVFKKPMHRSIDINLITKIEYAEFKTEADMNIYEIYLINKLKPALNIDDKTPDEVTVVLPAVEFKIFDCHLWDKWMNQINDNDKEWQNYKERKKQVQEELRHIRREKYSNKVTEEEYYNRKEQLEIELETLKGTF